jgi:hypothetical protein
MKAFHCFITHLAVVISDHATVSYHPNENDGIEVELDDFDQFKHIKSIEFKIKKDYKLSAFQKAIQVLEPEHISINRVDKDLVESLEGTSVIGLSTDWGLDCAPSQIEYLKCYSIKILPPKLHTLWIGVHKESELMHLTHLFIFDMEETPVSDTLISLGIGNKSSVTDFDGIPNLKYVSVLDCLDNLTFSQHLDYLEIRRYQKHTKVNGTATFIHVFANPDDGMARKIFERNKPTRLLMGFYGNKKKYYGKDLELTQLA